MIRLLSVALLVVFGVSGAIGSATPLPPQRNVVGNPVAPSPSGSSDLLRCTMLATLALPDLPDVSTRILSARVVDVPANGLNGAPGGSAIATSLKQYCQVTGYVAAQNKFELRLPLPSDWNQKLFFSTCSGFCGSVNGDTCNPTLARGYASVTTNGGHDGGRGFDGVWAASAPRLQEDFAWRGTHIVTLAAKAIIATYYGRPIVHAYISGCSKGGQAVLKEAQQFPDDYDGLIPIAPVYDYTGRSVIAAAWFAQAVSDGRGGSVLNQAAADAVHQSVLARCGAQAGVDEALVTDPMACDWQPNLIACPADASGPDCLTSRQVEAVKRLMSPAVNSKGRVVYGYPYLPGTETQWAGWNYGAFANFAVADQYLRFLADAAPRQHVSPLTFNFDRDPATLARARSLYDATSYDLRALKARGGKILMWHGLADGGIMASSSVGYYEAVMKAMGGRAHTEDFFRLFLIPGVHHCGGGPGLTDFDALTLLENWVEQGHAPDVLLATRSANGVVERSRPVYPYPIQARYGSTGDPTQAGSFHPNDSSSR